MKKVIVVVPCYNEEKRLNSEKFQAFVSEARDIGFLFVNDGSTDGTSQIIRSLQDRHPYDFTALDLPHNVGKAEAIRQGILKAMEQGPEYVGMWDADLSTPLTEIPRFVGVLDADGHVETVFGARVRLMGRCIERAAVRHYLGRFAATLISWTLGITVYDTQCGAKLFRVGEKTRKVFQEPFSTSWIFDVEVLARLIANGSRTDRGTEIYELPLNEWIHTGDSKLRPLDYLIALRDLYVIHRKYMSS